MSSNLHETFKTFRELQGLRQQDVLEAINPETTVPQSALSAFESGMPKIAREKLRLIAKAININPEIVDANSVYPFKSDALIKLYVTSAIQIPRLPKTNKTIHWFFNKILWHNGKLTITFLLCADYDTTIYSKPVYALIVKDNVENMYFIKRNSAYLFNNPADIELLKGLLDHAEDEYKMKICMGEITLSDEMYDRIRNCNRKEDIKQMMSGVEYHRRISLREKEFSQLLYQRDLGMNSLSENEVLVIKQMREEGGVNISNEISQQLAYQREMGMKPLTEFELFIINKMREKDISTDKALAWIKSYV